MRDITDDESILISHLDEINLAANNAMEAIEAGRYDPEEDIDERIEQIDHELNHLKEMRNL